MNIYMPKSCKGIINTFYNSGYEAFIVGGCVRDALMGREANDIDITTNSTPNTTIKLFEKTHRVIPTGEKHGTITLIDKDDGNTYEVTTYRIDGEYKDSRRPDKVKFTSSLKEDLLRRDFTINAMAYNEKVGLIDYFGGREDINRKIIRCVGDPLLRFSEDSLRIMRALRFKAQLGFNIDPNAIDAIKSTSFKLKNISVERIREEFNKIFISNPFVINDILEINILEYISDEVNDIYKSLSITRDTIEKINKVLNATSSLEKDITLRLTMLLYNIYRSNKLMTHNTEKTLKKLKYDNRTINEVCILIKYIGSKINCDPYSIKKTLNLIGEDSFKSILKLKKVMCIHLKDSCINEDITDIEKLEKILNEVLDKKECYKVKDLKINGNDIIEIGCKKGKAVGEVLEKLLNMVLKDTNMNTYEILLSEAKKII